MIIFRSFSTFFRFNYHIYFHSLVNILIFYPSIHLFIVIGIGAQTHKTEKALKKGILGLTKNFTDLADLAIAEYDEADLSPQVKNILFSLFIVMFCL